MTTIREWIKIIDTAQMLRESEYPDIMYHCTSVRDRESILQHGLMRIYSEGHRRAKEIGFTDEEGPFGGIFFATKPIDQTKYNLDTWQVDVRGLHIQPDDTTDPEDPNDTWWVTYDEDVSPDRLKLLYAVPAQLRESPWEQGEHSYDLPFADQKHLPPLTSEELKLVLRAKTNRKFARSLPVIEVPLDQIIPTQYWVHRPPVDSMSQTGVPADAREPVIFVRKNGETRLQDGHHRLVAALRSHAATLSGRILDFDTSQSAIDEFLTRARDFLLPRWRQWYDNYTGSAVPTTDNAISRGMCRISTVFLLGLLERNPHLAGDWRVAGGGPPDAGFWSKDAWHEHYWITDGHRILDITAGQFRGPRIVNTTPSTKLGQRYRDKLDANEIAKIREAARIVKDEWLPDWDEGRDEPDW